MEISVFNETDQILFAETFEEVVIKRPRDFTSVLSNGETIGEFYRRTGRNDSNADVYDQWIDPALISVCLRTLKKNPSIERLPNGLTPGQFSIDHVTGRYNTKKKTPRKRTKKSAKKEVEVKVEKEQEVVPIIPSIYEKDDIFTVDNSFVVDNDNENENVAKELIFGLSGN